MNIPAFLLHPFYRRTLILITISLLTVCVYWVAYLLRFDMEIPPYYIAKFKRTLPMVISVKLFCFSLLGQTTGYWRYVGLRDIIDIGIALFLSAATIFCLEFLFLSPSFPGGVVIIDFFISIFAFSLLRFSLRMFREIYRPYFSREFKRAYILGADDAAEAAYREIHRSPKFRLSVLGFIDKSHSRKGERIHNIRVKGSFENLPGLVEQDVIQVLVNTYDELSHHQAAILAKIKADFGCEIRSLTGYKDVVNGTAAIKRLGEIKFEDLLGRKSVPLDQESIKDVFSNKCVLITGAGGSIGSELCRQVIRFIPSQLLLLDKDETLLFEIHTELKEYENSSTRLQALIGDLRNLVKVETYFQDFKPDVVLHAAAYKHVPLLEQHPHEAFQNNVLGTRNILELCTLYKVERFVMISTDKAVKPSSIMGASKALAEKMLFQSFAPNTTTKCMAVRFGNVLGSRGSVIPLFQKQIEKGGPIRITHPEINRYFMSIPEAAQLVLQAGAMGNGGEIFILKMGQPVKIYDLALRLIEFSGLIPGADIEIQFTGLRPGEKLHEELMTDTENTRATDHDKILVVAKSSAKNEEILEKINHFARKLNGKKNWEIKQFFQQMVPDYHSPDHVPEPSFKTLPDIPKSTLMIDEGSTRLSGK